MLPGLNQRRRRLSSGGVRNAMTDARVGRMYGVVISPGGSQPVGAAFGDDVDTKRSAT
jgi:hypothetical protein